MLKIIYSGAFLICLCAYSIAQSPGSNLYEMQRAYERERADNKGLLRVDKQFRRAEYYFETRTDRNGDLVNVDARRLKALNKIRQSQSPDQQRSYSADWNFVGPVYHSNVTGIMGRVSRIAFHPTDPDFIYAATAGGGLWYTPNHGTIWYPLTDGIPVNNLSGVAVNYDDPNVIYILTGDGDGSGGGARTYGLRKPSIGVLKTTDGGQIWKPTGLTFDEQQNVVWSYDLKMHPADPETLIASTNAGMFRTYDGGISWDTVFTGFIYEIEFKPGDPDVIYAVDANNFYRSLDFGETWPDTIPIPAIEDKTGRMAITTCASSPESIYLIAAPQDSTTTKHRGLFYSDDSGESFNMVSDTPNVVMFQPNFDLTIYSNPSDVTEVLIGSVRIWKSGNGGEDFDQISSTHADIHDFLSNPLNDRLYVATDGGLYYSEDFGDTWTFMSEWLRITQYYKMAVSQQDENVVIAGAQDNGTHRNENGDAVMDRIYTKDGMDCAIHPSDDNLMIYSAQDGEFVKSTDGGDSYDSLLFFTSLPPSVESGWVTPVAWAASDPDFIMLGYKPVYRSTDGGDTFNPIPDTISGMRILHIGVNDADRVYAGDRYQVNDSTRAFHLWTSPDAGDTWSAIHTGVGFPDTTLILSGLTTNPDNANEVWITVGGWDGSEKVFKSVDAGANWTNMTDNLPNIPVNTIAYQDTDGAPADAVYVGTDLGVFYRDNNIGGWIHFSNGLPAVEVADLEVRYVDNKLVAATHGRGIWETDLFSSCTNLYVLPGPIQFTGYSYFFQASDQITSTALIDGFGSTVIYSAANLVVLEDGFRAMSKNGAVFNAVNNACGTPAPVLREEFPQPEIIQLPMESVLKENRVGD